MHHYFFLVYVFLRNKNVITLIGKVGARLDNFILEMTMKQQWLPDETKTVPRQSKPSQTKTQTKLIQWRFNSTKLCLKRLITTAIPLSGQKFNRLYSQLNIILCFGFYLRLHWQVFKVCLWSVIFSSSIFGWGFSHMETAE